MVAVVVVVLVLVSLWHLIRNFRFRVSELRDVVRASLSEVAYKPCVYPKPKAQWNVGVVHTMTVLSGP